MSSGAVGRADHSGSRADYQCLPAPVTGQAVAQM